MPNAREFKFQFKSGGDFNIPAQSFAPIGAQDPNAAGGEVGFQTFPPQIEGFQQARPVDFPTEPGAGGVGQASAQFPQQSNPPATALPADGAGVPAAGEDQVRPLCHARQRLQEATSNIRERLLPNREASVSGPLASRLANFQPLARLRMR